MGNIIVCNDTQEPLDFSDGGGWDRLDEWTSGIETDAAIDEQNNDEEYNPARWQILQHNEIVLDYWHDRSD